MKKKVLFIDDDRDILETYCDYFEDESIGDDIEYLIGGNEIPLEVLSNRALIICDLNMPKESGRDILKKLRAVDQVTNFWIFSGHIEDEIDEEMTRLGANKVLSKPMGPDELGEMILSVLDNGEK